VTQMQSKDSVYSTLYDVWWWSQDYWEQKRDTLCQQR